MDSPVLEKAWIRYSPYRHATLLIVMGFIFLLEGCTFINFSDPILSPQFGTMGYWKPLTFLREVGFCLFFHQEYDARKTPILFVHGAAGTPLGWENIVRSLDLHHFQPLFYYYPSGLPVDKVSDALNRMVMALHRHYQFKDLYVVAHSMGGLVSRSFILKNGYESQQDGDCSLFLENNDGTVELSSELDMRAQREAQSVFGYDEDHGSILFSEEVLAQIKRLVTHYPSWSQ